MLILPDGTADLNLFRMCAQELIALVGHSGAVHAVAGLDLDGGLYHAAVSHIPVLTILELPQDLLIIDNTVYEMLGFDLLGFVQQGQFGATLTIDLR